MHSKNVSPLPTCIIGAGVAGLICARQLIDAGEDVFILEASNRIGGRIRSEQFENDTLDLGASWIHGIENNPIWNIVIKNNIQTEVFNYLAFRIFDENGKIFSPQEQIAFEEYIQQILTNISEYQSPSNLEKVIKTIIQGLDFQASSFKKDELQKLLLDYFSRLANDPFATELSDLSVEFQKYEGYFEGDEVIFPKGYRQIIDYISQELPIQKNTPITAISLTDYGVELTDRSNNKYQASRVVLTVPLGVLKSNQISFKPVLPDTYRKSINTIGYGSFNKVFMEFDQPLKFTQNTTNSNSDFYWFKDRFFNILDLSKIYKKPVYLMLFGGEQSEFIDQTNDQSIWDLIYKSLSANFTDIPLSPLKLVVTRWGAEEFSLGSFSYPSRHYKPELTAQFETPIENKLFFAGEHCHALYAGTVHGAYLSGYHTAEKILAISKDK